MNRHDDLMETLGVVEDLHNDLTPYLSDIPGLGSCLRHPLVYSVPHAVAFNGFYNLMYAQKLRLIAEAEVQRNVWNIIHLHEPPYRVCALSKHSRLIEAHADFWDLVRQVWVANDNPHEAQDLWERIWYSRRPDRHHVMSERERTDLAARPETFRIWRGGHHRKTLASGFSWTLDRDQAVWFARRFEDPRDRVPHLAEATVRREHVFALLHTGEAEVIPDPTRLTEIRLTRVPMVGRNRKPPRA